jgi:predicted dehydrogenase
MGLDDVATLLPVNRPLYWGILGTGAIAHRFADDFVHVKDGALLASGSRNIERARVFADRFKIPDRYGSYQALVDDPRIDAVYIATPASEHKQGIELCLRAGKAVLCEKPLTVNAQEAKDIVSLARTSGVFVMEAMWTRFLPLVARLRDMLDQNIIGDVRHLMADVASEVDFDAAGRVFNPELGGGALLQKGIYVLSLASMMFGSPTKIKSLSVCGESGVDQSTGILLAYPKGQLATLWCSVEVRGQRRAVIAGSRGQIVIHDPIMCPSTLTLRRYASAKRHKAPLTEPETGLKARILRYAKGRRSIKRLRERFPGLSDRLLYGIRSSTICAPPIGEGLHYQVAEVNRCLRAGQLESRVMPLNESMAILKTMDRIRVDAQEAAAHNCER